MITRCKWCGSIAPDFSDVCDGCANIEFECEGISEAQEEYEREVIGDIWMEDING